MPAIGKLHIPTLNPKNQESYKLEYLIVEPGFTPLLGACTIQQLDLMTVNNDNVFSINAQPTCTKPPLTRDDILLQYNDVFTGQGKLVEELHLEVDAAVHPVKIPTRKVPLAMKDPIKQELDRLE